MQPLVWRTRGIAVMEPVEFENIPEAKDGPSDAASIGSATVERAVKSRMAKLEFKRTADYWGHLHASPDEFQELVETVVVPETWFLRDPQAFTALVRLAREERRSVLRLLSVPCSTGEEPYSLVMSLLDGGFLPQQLHVDAVDISARAHWPWQSAAYMAVTHFRGADTMFRDKYFHPTANGYALDERLRSHVTFHQRNLLSPDFGFQKESYDVIFCRNLLIYFDRATQEQAMKTLDGLLTPSGFLFVGPAEAFLASCSGFTSAHLPMSFAFRKTDARHAGPIPLPPGNRRVVGKTVLRPRRAIPVAPASTPVLPLPSLPENLEAARRLADAGRLQEAAAWCNVDLAEQGPSAETYYLLGLVCDAAGDREQAGACYQKAIYLQPEHVEALTHLALMKEGQGDSGGAARLHERARRVESSGRRVS